MFLAAAAFDSDSSQNGRGPIDDFWYNPTPNRGGSGIAVNDDTALRLAVLYACVNVISQDLAKVPLAMFRRDGDSRVRVTDHPVVKLLRDPARGMTAIDWKQRLEAHQLLRGNGYCEIQTDFRGRVKALPPWRADLVRVEVMPDASVRYHVRQPGAGTERTYVEGEVLHFRGLSLDGPTGLSPIDQERETIGEAFAAQSYASSFFANDARPGMWLKHPTHFRDESIREEWLKRFKRMFGAGNRFSPMITEYGIEIKDLPPPDHAALQFLELRKLKAVEMCAIFRVPPHKVAILERSTNNNIEHQGIEYVTDCLLTWCRRWEERLSADLLTDAERDEYYFEFLLDSLMRGDAKSRFDAYTSAVTAAGWMTRNEVRRRENMDALPNLDEPLQPVNLAPAGSVPAQPVEQALPSDDLQTARARELELQARRRVLTREMRALSREWERSAGNIAAFRDGVSSFYAWHLRFVAQALAIPHDQAEAYCMEQCADVEHAIACNAVLVMLDGWESDAKLMQFTPLPAAPSRKE